MPKAKKAVSIVDRRLQSGTIFRSGSRPIPLVEPDLWTLREVNTTISDQHLYEMQADKGWVYAEATDLAIRPDEIGYRVQDGRLVKGQQGQIVLMKMPKADYGALQKMKDTENRKQTFGAKANKAAILAAAGREMGGDEAADFLNRTVQTAEIRDSRIAIDD